MAKDDIIVFDPAGELAKLAAEIKEAEKQDSGGSKKEGR